MRRLTFAALLCFLAVKANGQPTRTPLTRGLADTLYVKVGASSFAGNAATASASDHAITPCGANTYVNALSTLWALTCTQPGFSTLSGMLLAAQTPAFTGGDVTSAGGTFALTVATVGGSTAANVHAAELLANAAVSTNTPSTIVKRDAGGNFAAGTITATLAGTSTNATNVGITNDNATNATMFPLWVTTASGNQAAKTSSTFIVFNPTIGLGLGSASAPLTKLTVWDTVSASPRGILSGQSSTDTNGARVGFAKSRGTQATPLIVATGDVLGRLMFRGHDGSNYLEMGSIEVLATGTIAATRVPTKMIFATATDAAPSILTTALTLGADQSANFAGKVGIGMTPSNPIDVTSTLAGLVDYIRFQNNTVNGGTVFLAQPGNGTTSSRQAFFEAVSNETSVQDWIAGMNGTKNFVIRDNTAGTDKFTIAQAGGTTINDNLTVTGTCTGCGGGLAIQNVRNTAQFDKTTDTTLANIPGLSANVTAGTSYSFHASLNITADVAGLSQAAINGTCTGSPIWYIVKTEGNATFRSGKTTTQGTGVAQVVSFNTIEIDGGVTVTVSGTLTVQFAQSVASGTSSVLIDSTFTVIPTSN